METSFFGVDISSQKPLTFNIDEIIHITSVSFGLDSSDTSDQPSIFQIEDSQGNSVNLAYLTMSKPCANLDTPLEPGTKWVFKVIGPRSLSICGYSYHPMVFTEGMGEDDEDEDEGISFLQDQSTNDQDDPENEQDSSSDSSDSDSGEKEFNSQASSKSARKRRERDPVDLNVPDQKRVKPIKQDTSKSKLSSKNISKPTVEIKDFSLGKGRKVKKGDTVTVKYAGRISTSKKFFDKGEITFKVGTKDLIEGWNIGIIGMQQKGQRRLTIPPHLGYGSDSQEGIPANSVLIFDMKLKSIK